MYAGSIFSRPNSTPSGHVLYFHPQQHSTRWCTRALYFHAPTLDPVTWCTRAFYFHAPTALNLVTWCTQALYFHAPTSLNPATWCIWGPIFPCTQQHPTRSRGVGRAYISMHPTALDRVMCLASCRPPTSQNISSSPIFQGRFDSGKICLRKKKISPPRKMTCAYDHHRLESKAVRNGIFGDWLA